MSRPLTLSFILSAFLLPSLAQAEDAWALRDAQALRWPDAEQISVELDQGEKVTVVYRDDGMVRVRKGAEFGWVPADALGDQDPKPSATSDDPWEIPDMPTLDIPGLGKAPAIEPPLDAAPASPLPAPPVE